MVEFYILRSKKRSGGKGAGTVTLLDIPFIAEPNSKLTIIHGLDSEGRIQVPGQSCQSAILLEWTYSNAVHRSPFIAHSDQAGLCRKVEEESRYNQSDSQEIQSTASRPRSLWTMGQCAKKGETV